MYYFLQTSTWDKLGAIENYRKNKFTVNNKVIFVLTFKNDLILLPIIRHIVMPTTNITVKV